jgi:hypothetical protein
VRTPLPLLRRRSIWTIWPASVSHRAGIPSALPLFSVARRYTCSPPSVVELAMTTTDYMACPAGGFRKLCVCLGYVLSLPFNREHPLPCASTPSLTLAALLLTRASTKQIRWTCTGTRKVSCTLHPFPPQQPTITCMHAGSAVLVSTQTEVDTSGKSYYGETNLYYISALDGMSVSVTLGKARLPGWCCAWVFRIDFVTFHHVLSFFHTGCRQERHHLRLSLGA